MPNTLAHFGVQSLISKATLQPADIKWIGLGCILPDIPWILQRLIQPLAMVNPVYLRLFVIVQSTLFFSLLPAGAISLQMKQSRKIFIILAVNIFIHLLLDSTQIKWANGTHLLAPFSWKLLHFNWYWPEQFPSLLVTGLGLFLYAYWAWQDRHQAIIILKDNRRRAMGAFLLVLYMLLPLLLLNGPLQANNHFTATLLLEHPAGKAMEIDRKNYRAADHTITTLADTRLQLRGTLPPKDALLSIKGRFINDSTILVSKYHVHSPLRDIFSLIGLGLFSCSWLLAVLQKRIRIQIISSRTDETLPGAAPGKTS